MLFIINAVLLLLAGLGVFLLGIKFLGDNLEVVAGSKLRKLFNKISNNRFAGMGIGAGVTAVIQSSSATTVMVVGFVNAGVLSLFQAATIIMGANIGTTITAQIIQFQAFNATLWFAALSCIGFFMMTSKKDNIAHIGAVIAGLGMIFAGLQVMSTSMSDFKELPAVIKFFQTQTNPILLLLMGMAFTALVQSSSATTGILITMAGAGIIPFQSTIFVLIGTNIGTCITAILASIGATTNAKRASVIHLLFNIIGALVFLPFAVWTPLYRMFEIIFPNVPETQIAMFHTFFNVVTTLLLIPFTSLLVKAATFLVPEKKNKAQVQMEAELGFVPGKLKYTDDLILSTPTIAMSQIKKEILFMAELAKLNLDDSVECVTSLSLEKGKIFAEREKQINFMNREITKYLVHISSLDIGYRDEVKLGSYYHVVSDIERIGDYAENILEYTQSLIDEKIAFSNAAVAEIKNMADNITVVYENTIRAFTDADLSLLPVIDKYEDIVDECKRQLSFSHIERLNKNECSPESGALFLSLISNMERISDHMTNIAVSIKDYAKMPMHVNANVKKKKDKEKEQEKV